MCNGYTQQQICLMNRLRQLWQQHVYWTRFFIVSTAANLEDLKPVTNRLLQNPKDFAQLFTPICGTNMASQFQELFTQHLLIAADLVNAAKNGEKEAADCVRQKWYQNADEIARFLSSVNRCWNEAKWREMLHCHLKMTEKEAALYLQGNYAESIQLFNDIEQEALKMANDMFCGVINCRAQ